MKKDNILFTSKRPDVVMTRGKGMYLYDSDGNKYLDFVAGWAVNSLGHSPDIIRRALTKQAKELVNCSPGYWNRPMLDFAEYLTSISCFDRVFFINSGAEANEGAIKLARKFGEKFRDNAYEIITTVNAFHGRTLATMSATGKALWKDIYEPKVQGFVHLPLNDIDAVRKSITSKTCAVMLELVQGEGGVNTADKDYVMALRKLCDENNIMLIFDEVQTGIGRCGAMFAYEIYGVEPDIMTLAKGIGGGFPLSAMLTKEKFNIFEPGDQGGTYSSQPLAMSVGLAVVKEVYEKKLYNNSRLQGEYIKKKLSEISGKYKLSNIRGMGLLIAFDLSQDKGKELVSICMKNKLLVNSPKVNAIRLMPALNVSKKDIDLMIERLKKSLDEAGL